MNRHEQREHAFKLLFCMEFHDKEEADTQVELYLSGIDGIEDAERDYIRNKYENAAAHIAQADSLIEGAAKGWKLSRIGKTDLAILRLAVYEMKYDPDIPVKVAANEAVELAKEYGGNDSYAFVNGVLGKIARDMDAV